MALDLDEVYERRKNAATHQADWREEARECFEFRDGEQWTAEDEAKLEEAHRPIVTFNRVGPVIDAITGAEINNRQDIKFEPRTLGDQDPALARMYTETVRWIRDGCDAEEEESDAYGDAATCGIGWMEIRVDYDEDPDGKILQERVPPLQMRWDAQARKRNLTDRRWDLREKWLPLEEIEARWPRKFEDIDFSGGPLWDDQWLTEHDASSAWQYKGANQWYESQKKQALVLHYEWREREPFYRVADPDSGRIVEFAADRWEAIRAAFEARGLPLPAHVRQQRWTYRYAIICGRTVLEEGEVKGGGFSRQAITAKREEKTGLWYGFMRAMKDPQRWANKFFSLSMHIMAANAKGGLMVEESAVPDMGDLEATWADPSGVSVFEDGALVAGKVKEKAFGGYPSSLDKLLQFAIGSIRDTTGINLELLGLVDREQSGVVERERKQAALTILAPLLASLRHYRKEAGRRLIEFARTHIPANTLIRIVGSNGAQSWMPFVADPSAAKFDIIVETAPSSPSLKAEVWSSLQNLIPAMVKAGVPFAPELVRFSPLPSAVAEEWVKTIREGGMPAQVKQQIEQQGRELEQLRAENQQLQTKGMQRLADIQAKRELAMLEYESNERIALLEARSKEIELLYKKQLADADREAKLLEINAKYELEIAKLKEQQVADREKLAAELAADRERNRMELEAKRQQSDLDRDVKLQEKQLEHAEFQTKEMVPQLTKLQEIEAQISADKAEREQRNRLIFDYLREKGGPVAELVERLQDV